MPQLAVSLSGQAETNGCQIARGLCKKSNYRGKNLLVLVEELKNEEFKLRCRFLVNAAGHGALDLHQSLTGVGAFQAAFCQGELL